MRRLVLGGFVLAIALLLVVFMRDTPVAGFYWWGGFLGAGLLVFSGVRSVLRARAQPGSGEDGKRRPPPSEGTFEL
jgi:hypothetical protein